MIAFLSKWIEGIAIAVIIASIFEMLLPKGNIRKYVKIVLGIFVVFSIISPFVDSKALYSVNLTNTIDNYSKKIEDKGNNKNILNGTKNTQDTEKLYKSTFEKDIKHVIENEGFIVYKCSVEGVFNAEKNDAGIKKIEIILDGKNENKNSNKLNKDESQISVNSVKNVKEIKKVEININNKNKLKINDSEITAKDIDTLKKYLSKHYELDSSVIHIKNR